VGTEAKAFPDEHLFVEEVAKPAIPVAPNPVRAMAAMPREPTTAEGTSSAVQTEYRTRSGRTLHQTQVWKDIMDVQRAERWEVLHNGEYDTQEELEDPLCFVASNNPDILYLNKAMSTHNAGMFETAMADKVRAHTMVLT
jgi:hypothetical protein